MKKLTLLIVSICLTSCLQAGNISFAWDAAIGDVTGYRLYAHNEPLTNENKKDAKAKVDLGLVTQAKVYDIPAGILWFGVTAYNEGAESDLSNIIVHEIPEIPTNLRVITLQHSVNLQEWNNVGFFKIKID